MKGNIMKIEIISTKKNHYKLISRSNRKSKILSHIASIAKQSNKISPIKLGVYNIPNTPFSKYQSVYSYISNITNKMNKKTFYQFINGDKHFEYKKPLEKIWKPVDPNCIMEEETPAKSILDFMEI